MNELKPSLSDVAQTIYWEEGLEIGEDRITEGLNAAGIEPQNEKERNRLRNLIVGVNRLRNEDRLCERLAEVHDFLDDARQIAGDNSDIEEVIEIARDLKSEIEADTE